MGENSDKPPIVTGASLGTKWQNHKQNIWKARTTSRPIIVVEDNATLQKSTSPALLDGQWFWKDDSLYYRPASGKPDNHEVWRTARGGAISIKNKSWIKISDI